MLIFGHLGLGGELGRPLISGRDVGWLLVGTVLPDLVDKPVYYGLAHLTGRHAAALGLISGTRTLGHTLLFALALLLFSRSSRGAAVGVGVCTHLALDILGDQAGHLFVALGWSTPGPMVAGGPSTLSAVFFPLLGPHFPIQPTSTMNEHLRSLASGWTVAGELVGGSLLLWRWRVGAQDLPPAPVNRGAAP